MRWYSLMSLELLWKAIRVSAVRKPFDLIDLLCLILPLVIASFDFDLGPIFDS